MSEGKYLEWAEERKALKARLEILSNEYINIGFDEEVKAEFIMDKISEVVERLNRLNF